MGKISGKEYSKGPFLVEKGKKGPTSFEFVMALGSLFEIFYSWKFFSNPCSVKKSVGNRKNQFSYQLKIEIIFFILNEIKMLTKSSKRYLSFENFIYGFR